MTDRLANALTPAVAAELLGTPHPVSVEFVRPANHTWRLTAADETFYVKAHTKNWYGGSADSAAGAVTHEVSAHRYLHRVGLATPAIVGFSTDTTNPLGWPYMLTRAVVGTSLVELIDPARPQRSDGVLAAAGRHLAAMHEFSFDHPGYITDGAPPPLDPEGWQHSIWRFERFVVGAMRTWSADSATVRPSTMDAVMQLFTREICGIEAAFEPPRFIHGDCHANQIYLLPTGDTWSVSAVLDMEVASAGAPMFDLVKMVIELRGIFHGSGYPWWQPLFAGYGREPNRDRLRVLLCAAGQINYTCGGWSGWPADRGALLRLLVQADTWESLLG